MRPASLDAVSCEQAPIGRPGAVQPYGVLLALDAAGLVVAHSDNLALLIGAGPVPALARPLSALLPAAAAEAVREAVCRQGCGETLSLDAGGRSFEVALHRQDGLVLLDLIPGDGTLRATPAALRQVQDTLLAVRAAADEQGAWTAVVEGVRAFTGFDRVKLYRFAADWSGEVVAEARAGHMAAYLGLHFPAGDIPPQARALYALSPVRLIPDAGHAPVPLLAAAGQPSPGALDLSRSLLRAVHPVHLDYLRHLGVGASMSVAIMRAGSLWGLIACHHPLPRPPLGLALLDACRLVAGVLADRLDLLRVADEAAVRTAAGRVQARMLRDIGEGGGYRDSLLRGAEELARLIGADGVALHDGEGPLSAGAVPPPVAIERLVAHLAAQDDAELVATDHLAGLLPEAASYAGLASGVMAVPLGTGRRAVLLWFRREVLRRVTWAGEPVKAMCDGPAGPVPGPRASFAAWVEEHRGRSLPWTEHERQLAAEVRGFVLDALLERAGDVQRLNRELRRRNEELSHTNHELSRSNKELDLFASVISHDLRSPLRGIDLLSRGLLEDMASFLSEDNRQDLVSIQGRAKRMAGMLDELLRYARLGREVVATEPICLPVLLRDILDLVGPPPGFQVEIDCAVNDLQGEQAALRLVLLNLVTNAVEHHDRDAGRIEVRVEDHGDRVLFMVADDGPGIPPARRATMFRPFGAHGTKRGGGMGSGLGLAMAQRCVEQRHGSITVEGRADGARGTVIHFTWPKRPEPTGPAG